MERPLPSLDDGLVVEHLPSVGGSPKGHMTWEWHLPDGKQVTVYRRLAGEEFGGHFHKGEDPSKNPELFLLIQGTVEIAAFDSNGQMIISTVSAANGPAMITIKPYILHYMAAVSNVTFIEFRLTRFDPAASDCYPDDDFFALFPELKLG